MPLLEKKRVPPLRAGHTALPDKYQQEQVVVEHLCGRPLHQDMTHREVEADRPIRTEAEEGRPEQEGRPEVGDHLDWGRREVEVRQGQDHQEARQGQDPPEVPKGHRAVDHPMDGRG